MSTTPLEQVLGRLPGARKVGRGWRARCPVHQGASDTSLSLREAEDGRVLLHCHAGCATDAILTTLGLRRRDLFPDPAHPGSRSGTDRASPRRIVAIYDYRDAEGTLLYQVMRQEPKAFFQRRPNGNGGWINNLDEVQRVLYHLPELLAQSGRTIFFPEGEKDADALMALGLLATTAVGGANTPWLSAYTASLRGHHLVLLGDNDAPGRARVRTLARMLFPVTQSIRIVILPDLPPKGDVFDWIAAGGTKEQLIALTRATPRLTEADIAAWSDGNQAPSSVASSAVPLFPVDVFPAALQRYVVAGANAIGVPVDFVAIPLLGFAAGAIGNTRALRVKTGWIERAILWLAVIGDPGCGKSPALSHARHPIDVLQKTAWEQYGAALEQWEQEVLVAKAEKPPAPPPPKPILESYFTTDATIEAMAPMLGHAPGLAMIRDELVGWVMSHDAYRKAGDRQHWLSLWAGAPLKVDRRTSATIYVPRPTATVVGGIQPDLLAQLAAEANRRDGFVDRILAGWPVAAPPGWTEATVDEAETAAAVALFRQLRRRPYPEEPHLLDFTPEARAAFGQWVDENAALFGATTGLAAGFFAKFPGQCARIALILHCLHHPGNLTRDVDVDTVRAAIAVVEYFRSHLGRVLPAFGAVSPGTGAGLAARVTRLLERDGGAWISRTELHRGLGGTVAAEDLTAALADLALQGLAETRTVATGAREREEWRWGGEDPEDDTDVPVEEYEEMKNLDHLGTNSSYLHSSSGCDSLHETSATTGNDLIQETFL